MNNADTAIERQKARTPGWEQTVARKMRAIQGIEEPAPAPAPPTNQQRAAYIAHQGGIRAFAQFFTELLDRIDELEASNTRLHARCADLELAETQRHARRKDKPLMATTP